MLRKYSGELGTFEYDDNEYELCKDVAHIEYLRYIGNGKNVVLPKGCISCFRMFCKYAGKELDLLNFDTSSVTTMYSMFNGCEKLVNLDLSNFDTSNVTNIGGMFYGCSSLTSLDLSNFDTSNVTTMCSMFSECEKLVNLDLSNFNTSNVTDMEDMFVGCESLTSLDLSNFNTSNVTDMGSMFCECKRLSYILGRNMFVDESKLKSIFNKTSIGVM